MDETDDYSRESFKSNTQPSHGLTMAEIIAVLDLWIQVSIIP